MYFSFIFAILSLAVLIILACALLKNRFTARASAITSSNIISIISDGLILLDKNAHIINVNKAALAILGYSESELVGKPFCDYFCRDANRADVPEKIARGEPVKLYDYHLQAKNKQEILIILTATPLRGSDGNIAGTVCLLTDISERRRMEEALRQSETMLKSQVEKLDSALKEAAEAREIMVSMLEDNNEVRVQLENKLEELKRTESMLIQSEKLASLGRLISDMAHEVNNPLMIITGNAQLALMEEPQSKEVENHLKIIVDQCNRAKGIIERLLKFSKPSKGEIREVKIEEVVEGVLTLIEHQFGLRNIKFIRNYALLLPPIKIDDKQIQEVFANLLTNSADAMSTDGSITVSTLREGDYIRVEFKDTGQGISEENLNKIFEPFFTTKDKGTGLGLAVCYGIMQAHGGQIKFSSKLGEGTTAIILLPVKEVKTSV